MVFHISRDPIEEMRAFIDTSFATHPDLRSHSGLVIGVGTPLLCKSRRQKIYTVNSSEAEIVAITDMIPSATKKWHYLLNQGLKLPKIILEEDNTATITLTSLDCKMYRSKYIGVRQIAIQDLLRKNQLYVRHCSTTSALPLRIEKGVSLTLHFFLLLE